MALAQLASGTPSTEPVILATPVTTVTELLTEAQPMIVPELIVEQAAAYGVDPTVALKIARCESNLQQFNEKTGLVIRGRENSDDVGVFQINEMYHLEKSQELGFDIETTAGNVEYAMWLIKHEGVRHWIWSKPCWNR